MDEEYVKYEEAIALQELGFDEYCMGACYYEFVDKKERVMLLNTPDSYDSYDGVKAPLYQQAFRWFREKHLLFSEIKVDRTTEPKFWFSTMKYRITQFLEGWYDDEPSDLYRTYEEAELACLKKLIEIAKKIKENDDLTSSDIVGY